MKRVVACLIVLFLLGCGSKPDATEPSRWDSARWNQEEWQ